MKMRFNLSGNRHKTLRIEESRRGEKLQNSTVVNLGEGVENLRWKIPP